MNREQQEATRDLQDAEARYLRSYGWICEGGRWRHPRARLQIWYKIDDAVAVTRAEPLIRMGGR